MFLKKKNGKDTLGEVESLLDAHDDMGGGGNQSRSLALEVPPGYRLSNVVPHCIPVAGQNPCAFVRHFEVPDLQWTIPGRRVQATPSTDSDRVTVSLTGTRQKVPVGFDRRKAPSVLRLAYGKSFSVEFPKDALDVKLYCEKARSQRIFTLSDIKKDGDQIYLRSEDDGATSKILQMSVLPFDLVR